MELRRRRLERAIFEEGLTWREFAERAGVHERTVEMWIKCRERPTGGSRRRIADALGLAWGADCDSVWQADVEWLLEPCGAGE